MPYNRPPLSKNALHGEVEYSGLAFKIRASLADVCWRLGAKVVHADLATRTLTLADGSSFGFDGLVAATGMSAARLPLAGAEQVRHVIRSLDDSLALRDQLLVAKRLVVVGAGFIGCEVAATARQLGVDVTIVAPEEVPMQRPIGPMVGAELRRRHEARGVQFALGTVPVTYEEHDGGCRVTLSDGRVIDTDLVVEAVGCRPNTDWLDGNGLDLTDGVVCDNHLRADARSAVVAVGDVARFPNPLFDDVPRRVEHWSIPTDTARRAARTLIADLAGAPPADEALFMPMPSFWSDQFDLRIQSYGAPGLGTEDVRVLDGELSSSVVVGYHRRDQLMGVVALDGTRESTRYRSLIGAVR
jgi:3-phenylpropionate/trans-cinnamate dioxygenase ferredoxin reductase subunit